MGMYSCPCLTDRVTPGAGVHAHGTHDAAALHPRHLPIPTMTLATAPPARNVSPWTTRQKAARLLWSVTYALVFRRTFHNWYGVPAAILRRFGARVGRDVLLRRTARSELARTLTLGGARRLRHSRP